MKIIAYILAVSVIVLSSIWAYTQDQRLEPWTVLLSAILVLVGYFIPSSNRKVNQNNYVSGNNESEIDVDGEDVDVNQSNWFSFKNKQKIKSKK